MIFDRNASDGCLTFKSARYYADASGRTTRENSAPKTDVVFLDEERALILPDDQSIRVIDLKSDQDGFATLLTCGGANIGRESDDDGLKPVDFPEEDERYEENEEESERWYSLDGASQNVTSFLLGPDWLAIWGRQPSLLHLAQGEIPEKDELRSATLMDVENNSDALISWDSVMPFGISWTRGVCNLGSAENPSFLVFGKRYLDAWEREKEYPLADVGGYVAGVIHPYCGSRQKFRFTTKDEGALKTLNSEDWWGNALRYYRGENDSSEFLYLDSGKFFRIWIE